MAGFWQNLWQNPKFLPFFTARNTSSSFIQPIGFAVSLTPNIIAGPLLIHLIGGTTLALPNISNTTAFIIFK